MYKKSKDSLTTRHIFLLSFHSDITMTSWRPGEKWRINHLSWRGQQKIPKNNSIPALSINIQRLFSSNFIN